jgi:hypothetical protein
VLIGNEKYVDSEGNVVLYKTADGYKKADGTVIKKKDNDTENAASLNEISDDILKNIAKVVYTAGYKTVLEKDQVTDPIFDQVKLVNFKDDDGLENTDRTVGVTSMVIQADNLGEDITLPDRTHETETTDDDTFSAETLKKIYEIYFNQSVKGSDDDTVDNKIIDEKSKNSDYVNDYNIKGTQIIKSSFTDASEAFEDKKALTVGALTSDTITLTTTLNNVALTEDQADQMDTLSTVKAYYVTTVEDDLGVAEPTVTETECGDDVQVTYTRDAADSTKYTIKLIARKVTPERVSKDGQTTTTTIKLKLTSTQGVTANINGMTVSEAPDEYEEVGADSADGDGEEEGEEY